jgi:hypothetical protein
MRKMTPAEAAAYSQVRDTLRAALPKAPADYTVGFDYESDSEEGLLPEGILSGQMFQARYTARYVLNQSVVDQQAVSMQMDRTKGTPEQQSRLAALNARAAELMKARDTTRDRAEKDRIRAERKEVLAEADKVQAEIVAGIQAWLATSSAAQSTQDLDKSLPARELTIRILVNGDTHLPDQAAPFEIQGIPLAFEQAEGCQDFDTYCVTLFFGPFEKVKKVSGYTDYNLRESDLGIPTKARGIILTFSGPKERPDAVRDFIRQTDMPKIKALLP